MLSNIATRGGFGLAAVTLAVCLQPHAASASTLTPLYSFCAADNCSDGNEPVNGAVRDAAGNIYTSTLIDGVSNGGDVIELKRSHNKYKYQFMYRFCSQANCLDGETPVGDLIVDVNGNVYGATQYGGKHGGGAIFKLTPNAKQTKWKLSLLYNFCLKANCTDGAYPLAGLTYQGAASGLPYDGTSPMFGTASAAGGANGGVAFMLTPTRKNAKEKVIYNFCSQASCADGTSPQGALIADAAGNLYGTTHGGGSTNSGTAFELSPAAGSSYAQSVLYSFCQQANCADGTQPHDPLVMDSNGNLFGTTEQGGSNNHGVVFKIQPNGARSTQTVLYTFCPTGTCSDGYDPLGGLSIDANGDLLGTTHWGGILFGTIFKIHDTGESVLYEFCQQSNCADGAGPFSGVVLDGSGNMYGTTITGGAGDGGGTIWEFKP